MNFNVDLTRVLCEHFNNKETIAKHSCFTSNILMRERYTESTESSLSLLGKGSEDYSIFYFLFFNFSKTEVIASDNLMLQRKLTNYSR